MPATSGPPGSVSSRSADLSACLANRLAVRLGSVGSTLFAQTWKQKVTPWGSRYWAHTASGRRTSGSDCGSWPTPQAMEPDGEARPSRAATGRSTEYLGWTAQLAAWPSPTCNERPQRNIQRRIRDGRQMGVSEIAQLASWPTPCQQDGPKGGPGQGTDRLPAAASLASWATPRSVEAGHSTGNPARAMDGRARLEDQVFIASWATPRANDAEKREIPADDPRNGLVTQAQQTSGPAVTGSPAATAKPGQLNPAHSRWLMGYPPEWDACAPTETRSALRRRKRSSEHT